MFTRSAELNAVRRQVVTQSQQPAPGVIIRGFQNLPLRIHCRAKSGNPHDIFAYGTIIAVDRRLAAVVQDRYCARDFASSDFRGTKGILLQQARTELFLHFANDAIFATCDVLPVKSLRVVSVPASQKAVNCEIHEYCTPEEEELCAGLVAAIDAGVPEQEALDSFYLEFQKLTGDTHADAVLPEYNTETVACCEA